MWTLKSTDSFVRNFIPFITCGLLLWCPSKLPAVCSIKYQVWIRCCWYMVQRINNHWVIVFTFPEMSCCRNWLYWSWRVRDKIYKGLSPIVTWIYDRTTEFAMFPWSSKVEMRDHSMSTLVAVGDCWLSSDDTLLGSVCWALRAASHRCFKRLLSSTGIGQCSESALLCVFVTMRCGTHIPIGWMYFKTIILLLWFRFHLSSLKLSQHF